MSSRFLLGLRIESFFFITRHETIVKSLSYPNTTQEYSHKLSYTRMNTFREKVRKANHIVTKGYVDLNTVRFHLEALWCFLCLCC